MKLLPKHVEGARGMLKMSQEDLAKAAGVSARSIKRFEAGEGEAREETLMRIQAALEQRGIVFTNGSRPGVIYDPSKVSSRVDAS